MTGAGIEARGVGFAYAGRSVLDGVDLVALPGRVTGLVGPNGSGKTTLLRTLFGSLQPASGEVWVDGRPLASMGRAEVARSIAVVVQEDSGDTAMTVGEVVLLGRLPHRPALARTTGEDVAIAEAALRRVGAEHLARRQVTELSGGERQRVMVARALTQQAPYLLLDEPTNHLDIHYQHEVLQLAGLGATSVVVLHDLNLAARYCDDLVVLDAGRVVAAGSPEQVLTPDLAREVYRVEARVVDDPTCRAGFQLVFSPLAR